MRVKNLKYIIVAAVVIALVVLCWFYTSKSATLSSTNGNNDSGKAISGERACSNLVSASELNSVFGVNNFSLQVNSGVNCIWATGDIKSGIGSNILALSLNVAKIGANAVSLGESATVKNGGTPISGVAHAYTLSQNSGVVMFIGDYMYAFGTNDTTHTAELTALAKLIAGKN
ncbi:MAG TPA: hypothetical protein VI953_00190 [Candidatus Paceibacterota bacterium]